MNILDLKRRAHGWCAMDEGQGSGYGGLGGGGDSSGGDSSGGGGGNSVGGGPIGSESGAGYNSPSIGTDGLGGGWAAKADADAQAASDKATADKAAQDAADAKAASDAQAASDKAASDAQTARENASLASKAAQNSDSPMSPGWSSAKDSQAANDTMAKSFSSQFGVSDSVAQTAIGATNGLTGMVNPDGMTYSAVKSLSDQGFGTMTGVNTQNPDQTVSQALASKNVNDNVMPGVVGMIKAAVPGVGLLTSVVNQAGLVASNQKSFADAVKDSAVGFAAGWTAGKINSAVGSELGGMIGQNNLAGLQAASSISGMFGGPTAPNIGMGLVNGALSEAGISNPGGIASPGTVSGDNGFVKSGTTYGGDQGNGFTPNASTTTPATTTPATTSINDGLNFNMFDPAKIAAAKQQYFSK